jgi:hypothetical protein
VNSLQKGFLIAADECAKGRTNKQAQSPLFPWSDTIGVLEVSDPMVGEKLGDRDTHVSNLMKLHTWAHRPSTNYGSLERCDFVKKLMNHQHSPR